MEKFRDCKIRDRGQTDGAGHVLLRILITADRGFALLLKMLLSIVLLLAFWCLYENISILRSAQPDKELQVYRPDPDTGEGYGLDQLRLLNPDVAGWITIPGTPVDYPVLQGEDNIRYVNTDVYGQFCVSGSIFLDCRCARDLSDRYSLLYGHHMEGGRMFGSLDAFMDRSFLTEHPDAVLSTPDMSRKLHIFACMNADGYDQRWYDTRYYDGTATEDVIKEIMREAYPDTEDSLPSGIGEDTRIVACSTCAEEGTNRRILVFAWYSQEDRIDQEVLESET